MGEIMELIKDFLIIIGIFVCMSLGIFFLLQQLDDVLEQLQEMNAPLEKAMKAVRSFNEKVLSKK